MAATVRKPKWRDHGRETVGSDGEPPASLVSAICRALIGLTPEVCGRAPVLTMHSRAWSRCRGIVRAVESYREDGKVKQRVVADLDRKDLLTQIFPKLRLY